jgi:AraC-like DNA-binding protein
VSRSPASSPPEEHFAPAELGKGEACTFWRVQELGGLELLRARYITHTFAPHTHDAYALGVIDSGVEAFRWNGQMQYAPAGSVVMVNPGEVHTGQAGVGDGFTYRMLYPDPAQLAQVVRGLGGGERPVIFRTPVVQDPEAAARLRAMHAGLQGPETPLKQQTLFLSALGLLVERYGVQRVVLREPGHEPRAVARARDYLEAHLTEPVTLADLAAHAGVSAFHLVRLFRRAFGLPPHAYQVQQRVARARELLLRGTAPGVVALELGFADQSHLTREFKRRVGVTPARYATSAGAFKTPPGTRR